MTSVTPRSTKFFTIEIRTLGIAFRLAAAYAFRSRSTESVYETRPSRYRPIFEVVFDYESGTWEQLEESCRRWALRENFLTDLYLQAVRWVSDILVEVPVSA